MSMYVFAPAGRKNFRVICYVLLLNLLVRRKVDLALHGQKENAISKASCAVVVGQ